MAEGARVVVNDLDADALATTAHELGATAVPGDCASDAGVRALVDEATATLGRIDVYLANAGIDSTSAAGLTDSLQADDEVWARMLDVNVMAHVRAARLLVPTWLDPVDGGHGGRLVVTASAAGLLTMIGAAPYSVTKHARGGLRRVALGHLRRVVGSSCRPSARRGCRPRCSSRPARCRRCSPTTRPSPRPRSPDAWIASLADDRFLVLPHPEVAAYYAARAADPDRWLAGMRRLQAKVDAAVGAEVVSS